MATNESRYARFWHAMVREHMHNLESPRIYKQAYVHSTSGFVLIFRKGFPRFIYNKACKFNHILGAPAKLVDRYMNSDMLFTMIAIQLSEISTIHSLDMVDIHVELITI